MTLNEIRDLVMHQTGNDFDDVNEYLPYLNAYVNEGYDDLVFFMTGKHLGDDGAPTILEGDEATPSVPEWLHPALSYYATYCLYRNGNAVRQQRGIPFLDAYYKMRSMSNSTGGRGQFRNHMKA